ncbi:hypothetical protein RUM44_000427 [Polyplax serrata]|uniref:Uncharacterized protein n=1 Tax=Polyplax serrata TaxID=468196 RepID=A0ABR1B5G2_POLSC
MAPQKQPTPAAEQQPPPPLIEVKRHRSGRVGRVVHKKPTPKKQSKRAEVTKWFAIDFD